MLIGRILPSPLPGEHVLFYLRRHWFTLVDDVVGFSALLILPLMGRIVLPEFFPDVWSMVWEGGLLRILATLAVSLYYLYVWGFFWHAMVDYYLDVWLVTNERILSLEQKGLFNRTVAELRLEKVQDVTSNVTGFFETVLHYGNVTIQTAGELVNFHFREIPKPYEVAEKVLRLADDWHKHHPFHDTARGMPHHG